MLFTLIYSFPEAAKYTLLCSMPFQKITCALIVWWQRWVFRIQNKVNFLKKTELRDMGCVFPHKSPLRSITLFSAQQNYKQPRKSADEHENTVIDIRAYPNNQILSQDATAIQPTSTVYTSRK